MSKGEKDDPPDIGIAIFFGFVAVALPLLPTYFGWTAAWVQWTCFVLAGIALLIGIVGAAIELRELGFFEGPGWENFGYSLVFAIFAVLIHVLTTVVTINWLDIVLKIVVVVAGLLALGFLGFALGGLLVDQRRKRESGGVTVSSRTKAVGATAVYLITLLTAVVGLVAGILQFLAARQ